MRRPPPHFAEELALHAEGYGAIAGVDEVGRGALAGDVLAAAVILPAEAGVVQRLQGVRDSKQLTPLQRVHLCIRIQAEAVAIGLGRVPADEIDRLGIVQATRRAMALAVAGLAVLPDFILIDALRLPAVTIPQKAIVHGDALCLSIAAASVVAKVARDTAMAQLDLDFPGYGFARHKGYGTTLHRQQIASLGPCDIHRLSFAPLRVDAMAAARDNNRA